MTAPLFRRWDPTEPPAPAALRRAWTVDGGFGGTVLRPALYSRNGVTWTAVRAWGASAKTADLEALKRQKAAPDSELVDIAVGEIAGLVARAWPGVFGQVTAVAPGHSRRSDAFGVRLAQGVAATIGARFTRCFEDRFVSGSSHPKEFAKLAPLQWAARPATDRVLVVDDVATSGWHMEEAINRLRELGVGTAGIVWIGGNLNA